MTLWFKKEFTSILAYLCKRSINGSMVASGQGLPVYITHLRRARLIERLDGGLAEGSKLSLISDPAGFGKTTLVSEWVTDGS